MGDMFGGALSGILQMAIAALLVILALKVFKNIAKGLVITIVCVAGFLLVKGIIDWAMIASIGQGLFQWISDKIGDGAQAASFVLGYLK